ncbi:MAG: GDSL-type esterase/lipase family protein [Gammaproteobacteria bacterium]
MIRRVLFLILLLLTACTESPKTIDKLPANAVILAFGDSLTFGTGASPAHDYPTILSKLTGLKVINKGRPGEISSDGLRRLPLVLEQYDPKLLILIHGGNDIIRKIPSEQIVGNLKQMIALAKERRIHVVMLGVPKPNLFMLASADFYRTLADEENVLADLTTLPEILGDYTFKSDLIHPNDKGYERIATQIHSLLVDSGAL